MLNSYGANFTLFEAPAKALPNEKRYRYILKTECRNRKINYGLAETYIRVERAIELMEDHEKARGWLFQTVVKLRPDLKLNPSSRISVNARVRGIPVMCGSVGGGG